MNQVPILRALTGLLAFSAVALAGAQVTKETPPAFRMRTPWAKDVSPMNALPDYPRPQLARAAWKSLNGIWSYAVAPAADTTAPTDFSGKILVPFPYESALSGIGAASIPDKKLWYRRTFVIPANWKGKRVLLHFGAVNYLAEVVVNGRPVGKHQGGFDGFTFDITSTLKPGENDLNVGVQNPLRTDVVDAQVVGKQRLNPSGIFYTGATGIWQSVWLEPVPLRHIDDLKLTPDFDRSRLLLTAKSGSTAPIKVTVLEGKKAIATKTGATNRELSIPIPGGKPWSPDSPKLYDVHVTLGTDKVTSYFALRKVSLGKDAQGRQQILLNNKFVFQVGALDQGYWPDGIFTAPTDAALKSDILAAKALGFNLLRKHAKVEPARWYYHTDRLGMLVWQDMPQMYGGTEGALTPAAKAQFELEWRRIIAEHYNSPSIIVWTTFNEGWGQYETPRIVDYTRKLDPTRLVNNASGWTDQKVGDLHDTHAYPGPWAEMPEPKRAAVNGEFGGVTLSIPGKRWNLGDVMGYGSTLQSSWKATRAYQGLLKKAYDLKTSRSTSAVVYTQLTDVEQEINGLLTYDRTMTKLDPVIVSAANRGEFLPMGNDPHPDLVPTSEDEGILWRYTTETPAAAWFAPELNDASWKEGLAPFGNDLQGLRTPWTTSDIWIRRRFTLPTAIPEKLLLKVRHDEDAEIYINGILAATVKGYTQDYAEVPISPAARASLKPGPNTFAVHCHQTIGGQSIDIGITTP